MKKAIEFKSKKTNPFSSNQIMKSAAQILDLIRFQIEAIYLERSPLSIGGTPYGIDMKLYTLHDLFARATGVEREFEKVWLEKRNLADANTTWFSFAYDDSHPDADRSEVARYTVNCWKDISERLGVFESRPEGV